MSCNRPISIKNKSIEGNRFPTVMVPCGRCRGCRRNRQRQWAFRIVKESKLYKNNSFLTLTYDDKKLGFSPVSLDKGHFQKFMKRLRYYYGNGIRYYMCGEYGDNLGRPHYHVCLFNCEIDDKVFLKKKNGVKLYNSQKIYKIWKYGNITLSDITIESAMYVASYTINKIDGELERKLNYYDGKEPEYGNMSRAKGIGKDFIINNIEDVYRNDCCVLRGGERFQPPRYYDEILKNIDVELYNKVKKDRKERMKEREYKDMKRVEGVLSVKAEKTKRRKNEKFISSNL